MNVAAFDGRSNEASLVAAIRASAGFIRELSLVAERAAEVGGHVMLSRLEVVDGSTRQEALVLAPLAVRPEWQRRGVGSTLTRRALEAARSAGHRVVVLLGSPRYYSRFGFEPSAAQGIVQPFPVGDASQVVFLDEAARGVVRGTIAYPEPFHAIPGILP